MIRVGFLVPDFFQKKGQKNEKNAEEIAVIKSEKFNQNICNFQRIAK